MDLNVALLPDEETASHIAALSRRLEQTLGSSLLLLNDCGPFPHLTLYLTGFPDDSVALIVPLIRNNIAHLPAPALPITGARVRPDGYVWLDVERTVELDNLHRWMLHKLNPMRMSAQPQLWEAHRDGLTPNQRHRLSHLGYPQALDEWSPHFTIGRIEPGDAARLGATLGTVEMKGQTRCIGFGRVGSRGEFTEVLETAEFGA